MLSDTQWAALEPLVDLCRPKAKTPPQDLQRTLSAILWRHQNGAKWRAMVQERGVQLGMVFLDGTNMRAHQKAAGAAKRGDLQPSETIVKLLAAHVAAMAPRLA